MATCARSSRRCSGSIGLPSIRLFVWAILSAMVANLMPWWLKCKSGQYPVSAATTTGGPSNGGKCWDCEAGDRQTCRDSTWEFLRQLPASLRLEHEGTVLALYHGSPASDTEMVTAYKPLPPSIEQLWDQNDAHILVLGHAHIPMIDRGARGMVINPGSVLGVPGVQTSYTFGVLDIPSLAVQIHEVRTGREIRRDPINLDRQ